MTDDTPDTHEEMDEVIVEAIGELQDDPGTDLDASKRQDAGWFSVYIECPECEAPMARSTTESEGESDGDIRVSRSELRGVCPDCGKIATALQVVRYTGPFGDDFPPMVDDTVRELADIAREIEDLAVQADEPREVLEREGADEMAVECAEDIRDRLDQLVEKAKRVRTTVELEERDA